MHDIARYTYSNTRTPLCITQLSSIDCSKIILHSSTHVNGTFSNYQDYPNRVRRLCVALMMIDTRNKTATEMIDR